MGSLDAYNILNYGVIGLGFLLAFLAYRLLGREQQNPEPRRSILVAIHVFMIFSVVLCIIGFGSEYLRSLPSTATLAEIGTLKTQLSQQQGDLENQIAENRKLNLVLQKYRDSQKEYVKRSRHIVSNLKLLNSFVPAQLKESLNQLVDTLQASDVEE
jgi:apolipoprotein N-acyltransferase